MTIRKTYEFQASETATTFSKEGGAMTISPTTADDLFGGVKREQVQFDLLGRGRLTRKEGDAE